MVYRGGLPLRRRALRSGSARAPAGAGLQLQPLRDDRLPHLIVPKSRFRLTKGEGELTTVSFNTGVAQHKFCRTCGIKSFYVPRSNPDGIDVNVRCLDEPPGEMTIEPFDGRDWEQHGAELAHLSKEG
jgi:hypothetical protein